MKTIELDVGDRVFCDLCNEEYTTREDPGGFLFQSKAVCPECAPEFEAEAKRLDEEYFIRARCPEGMSFADWVRSIR